MRSRVTAVVLAIGLAIGGCAKPDFQYIAQAPGSSGAGQVFFKVPSEWTQFSASQITAAQSGWSKDSTAKNLLAATVWQSAFDASASPSLVNVLGTRTPDQPTVFASLRNLFSQETPNDAALRDMIVPISTFGSSVQIDRDEKVSQGGAHGVHVVISYRSATDQMAETIDQTALLNGAKNAVYVLIVRCSSECYNKNRESISAVTGSFTIQEGHHG